MATKKARAKTPREQSPKLIGFSHDEAAIVEQAAHRCDMPCAAFIRECALVHAVKINKGAQK